MICQKLRVLKICLLRILRVGVLYLALTFFGSFDMFLDLFVLLLFGSLLMIYVIMLAILSACLVSASSFSSSLFPNNLIWIVLETG